MIVSWGSSMAFTVEVNTVAEIDDELSHTEILAQYHRDNPGPLADSGLRYLARRTAALKDARRQLVQEGAA